MVVCFKCEKEIETAFIGVDPWDAPSGVSFEGGWNFGSAIYDAMVDGVYVEIVICDDCLKTAKQDPSRLREMRKEKSTARSVPV